MSRNIAISHRSRMFSLHTTTKTCFIQEDKKLKVGLAVFTSDGVGDGVGVVVGVIREVMT